MFKLVISILAFCSASFAEPGGFEKGNTLTATPVQGEVRMICAGFNGSGSALYSCRDTALNPGAYDYFVGPRDARATKVELTAYHQDGSTRTKAEEYQGSRGRSGEAFNLWISTLFQKPLLEAGSNRVTFKLMGNSAVYAEGSFTAVVTRGAPRTCPTVTYQSSDINDCNSQYSICQRYFREHNNCE